MNGFEYCLPTKIIFGKESENKIGKELTSREMKRAFIVYGGGSVIKSGLMGRIESSLQENGIEYTLFGGVLPNPHLDHAMLGVREALKFNPDIILAVGGGSVIDTAKGIAHGVMNKTENIWQYWTQETPLLKSMPVGVVLTISAAGSETSDSAVLTDTITKSKRGLSTPFNRPMFAIMNPELTYTLPKYQIACGITDIMMHTMERYFTHFDNELTDSFAEALLRTMIKEGKAALENPCDYYAMSEVMWAGSISHDGLTGLGGVGDWATHALGQQLSAFYDIAHGASLAIMWGYWARYVYKEKVSRFARYARNIWGVDEKDDEAAALSGIEKTSEFFKSIGMPISINSAEEIGHLDDSALKDLAFGTTFELKRTIGNFKKLEYDDIYNIFKSANN